MVTLGPIDQFGCFNASFTVIVSSCCLLILRNGPPEAVNRIFSSFLLGSPLRDWNIALCSLSTGRIFTLCAAASGIIRCPAVTSVSLFASAISFPLSIAAIVGRIPIIPTTAVSTVSASGTVTSSIRPSIPAKIFTGRSATFTLSSCAAAGSNIAA